MFLRVFDRRILTPCSSRLFNVQPSAVIFILLLGNSIAYIVISSLKLSKKVNQFEQYYQ